MLKTVRSTVNVDQITGVLPVVNGGTGVTTSTGTGSVVLSAAPTLSGNVGLSTGNIVQGTAAKGINFTANTPAAGKTSQLLNWYEEGTWNPQFASTGATISLNTFVGTYTRVGRQVTVTAYINVASKSGTLTNALTVTGLPFTSTSAANNAGTGYFGADSFASAKTLFVDVNSTTILIFNRGVGTGNTATTAADLVAANSYYIFTVIYCTS